MRRFEYDMSKVELKVVESNHSNYSDVKLCKLIGEFIKNN